VQAVADIQEGDRFEEILPTGEAGTLWQVISRDGDERAHVFSVDDPGDVRVVHLERLLDPTHYRLVEQVPHSPPEVA
jgi:hypothetical protein